MVCFHSDDVERDGFISSYGRFYAGPGRVERLDGPALRELFLPKVSPHARTVVGSDEGERFIRGQLKHYDVSLDENDSVDGGVRVLQQALAAGKCDVVPKHILELQEAVHQEWLGGQADEDLMCEPEWVLQRYFLTKGEPDRSKTPRPISIPLKERSSSVCDKLLNLTSQVPGLCHKTAMGLKTQVIYIGWNAALVALLAAKHADIEARLIETLEQTHRREHAVEHEGYLRTLKQGPRLYSVVGEYAIDCHDIVRQWPDQSDGLSMSIRRTEEPDVFEASFGFGIVEGAMFLSADKAALEAYCVSANEREGSPDDAGHSGYRSREASQYAAEKRKARQPKESGRPLKKSKKSRKQEESKRCLDFHLRLKCRETGEGEIQLGDSRGKITFKGATMAAFEGIADLPIVGSAVPFSARKVSDTPAEGLVWEEFAEISWDNERLLAGNKSVSFVDTVEF